MSIPAPMPTGPRGCASRKRDGALCTQPAISGTVRCRLHAGVSTETAKARGQVVVELRSWGLDLTRDQLRDPGVTLLQLMTQSAMRVELYARLLGEAYDAAERLQEAQDQLEHGRAQDIPGALTHSTADWDRASQDLQRIFNTGPVAALIGHTYTAGGEGGPFAASEAIRGLVQLEAAERDRCATMATKAIAAGLAERQVRLAERQGAMVAELIRTVLADPELGLSEAQRAAASPVAARHLRALAGVS